MAVHKPMTSPTNLVILLVLASAIVVLVAWALLGPRRRADESGPHVDLAEQTRRRNMERRLRGDDSDED